MINKFVVFAFFLSVISFGCQTEVSETESDTLESQVTASDSEGSKFRLLPASETGVDFSNVFDENYDVNPVSNTYLYNGGGVGIIDFNNDSLPDLFFTSVQKENKLYLNKGNLKFEDITESAGLVNVGSLHSGVTVVDINSDGWQDIYVCKAGKKPTEDRRNLLYINNGDNTFSEKANEYGLADKSSSNSANFFDYDLDGDLDMYLLNYPTNFKWSSAGELIIVDGKKVPKLDPKNPFDSDRLYRNNGNNTFTDVTVKAGMAKFGYGLSVTCLDINEDRYPDLYIANDFIQSDILYINNGDGTFTDKINDYFTHISSNSMGADVGDINNDGLPELISLDMLPADNYRQKTLFSTMIFSKYITRVGNGYGEQYVRNQLHLNNGISTFSEIGCLSDVFQTDWSWAPLFQDFDNDGFNDLYITNGYYKDLTDHDYITYTGQKLLEKGGVNPSNVPDLKAFLDNIPSKKLKNYLYSNKGDLSFVNEEGEWINHPPSFSNGAAYADLDLDGDMDLVVNNIEDRAFLFENKNNSGNNYLQIKLKGKPGNTQAIGTKVRINYGDGKIQEKGLNPVRGFLSSVEPLIHFGLGKVDKINELSVLWPDGKVSTMSNISVNQRLYLAQESAGIGTFKRKESGSAVFARENASGVNFEHRENRFVDFNSYRLLPHELSRLGPKVAVGDVNGDSREDFFIGNGFGSKGALFVQAANGTFREDKSNLWDAMKDFEDMGAVFTDYDQDGDKDLVVVTGGYEANNPKAWIIRIHDNDGKGNFTKERSKTLPIGTCPGVIRAFDYDGDGLEDLFIGGRVAEDRYPYAPKSFIFKNIGKNYGDATPQVAPFLSEIGMITDIRFADLDGTPGAEMVVVGEWMGVRAFSFENGRYVEVSDKLGLTDTNGWWNCLTIDDYDNDGDFDLFVGNAGHNMRFKASAEKPILMYASDFDKNGSVDPIMAFYENGDIFPFAHKNELIAQLAYLKKKYVYHKDYAVATIEDIFSEKELESSLKLSAHTLSTSLFRNNNGKMEQVVLPNIAQVSPVFGILVDDFTGDGNKDVLLAGNDHGMEVETAHCDASRGTLLTGDGSGNFTEVPNRIHRFIAENEVRDLVKLKRKGKKDLIIVANNSGRVESFIRLN